MQRWAILSENHRYVLGRAWNNSFPRVLFILLNPSTADGGIEDPTSRKGIGFAKRLGYGSLVFCNLFAFRATNPKTLREKHARIGKSGWQEEWLDMVGPNNDEHIQREAKKANIIIPAWGAHETWGRDEEVACLWGTRHAFCFGKTKHGNPRHILYLPYTSKLEVFESIGER